MEPLLHQSLRGPGKSLGLTLGYSPKGLHLASNGRTSLREGLVNFLELQSLDTQKNPLISLTKACQNQEVWAKVELKGNVPI